MLDVARYFFFLYDCFKRLYCLRLPSAPGDAAILVGRGGDRVPRRFVSRECHEVRRLGGFDESKPGVTFFQRFQAIPAEMRVSICFKDLSKRLNAQSGRSEDEQHPTSPSDFEALQVH